MSNVPWNKFEHPTPYPVVAGFCVDRQDRVLMIHRSSGVRSAPNCWSLPSGLHDIGETQAECLAREIGEEFNLEADPNRAILLGTYENIPGDGWHWVIAQMVIPVTSFDSLVNKEPDKHDQTALIDAWRFSYPKLLLEQYPVHESATKWYTDNSDSVSRALRSVNMRRK